MRKSLFATLACISLSFGSFLSPSVQAQYFYPPEAYSDAVSVLTSAGVIDGAAGGDVRLYEYVNRAEALKVIISANSALKSQVAIAAANMPPISLFPDVDQRAWYATYVEVGFRNGLVRGQPDGFFWPQAGVKVSEAVTLLVRSMGPSAVTAQFLSSDDLPNAQAHWYTSAVSTVISRGGILPGSRLRLDNYMTRGQLFDMIYRTLFIRSASSAPSIQNQSQQQQQTTQPTQQVYVPQTVQSSAASVSYYTTNPSPVVNAAQFASKKPFAVTIPSIGIQDLTITHPSDPTTQKGVLEPLKNGVGNLFAYPGQGSKVLVYGHSSGYPWDLSEYTKIFRGINKVNIGDRIYVTYNGKVHVYEVTDKKTVLASDTSLLEPDEHSETLILYTCWPPDSITHRFLVFARPVDVVAAK